MQRVCSHWLTDEARLRNAKEIQRERQEVGFEEKGKKNMKEKNRTLFFYIKIVNVQHTVLQRLLLEDEVIHIEACVKSYQLMTAAISGALCN